MLTWTVTSDVQGRTTEVDTNAGTGEDTVGHELDYIYDGASRLTNVIDDRDSTCQSRRYGFDVNGNRTSRGSWPLMDQEEGAADQLDPPPGVRSRRSSDTAPVPPAGASIGELEVT